MVVILSLLPLWMARTPHPPILLPSLPRNLRVPQDRPIPQNRSPTLNYPRGRPTRSTNLRRLCGKTNCLMPKMIKLLKLIRISLPTGHHHPLTPQPLATRDHDHPFQMCLIHIILRRHALLVTIPLLVHIPSTPFPRPPRPISLRNMANGVASSALVQAVQCA